MEKLVRPVASKLSRVMEEEVKKMLEAEPEKIDGFSFRKKEASDAIRELLEKMFSSDEKASVTPAQAFSAT